jgi:hypothetical protein
LISQTIQGLKDVSEKNTESPKNRILETLGIAQRHVIESKPKPGIQFAKAFKAGKTLRKRLKTVNFPGSLDA